MKDVADAFKFSTIRACAVCMSFNEGRVVGVVNDSTLISDTHVCGHGGVW